MNWRRNSYNTTWGEFFVNWLVVLVGGSTCLFVLGLVFKLMWRVFMFGWGLV